MSATVESPMPWRKSYRVASNQVTSGTLFRSTSSQSNLAASGLSAYVSRVQKPASSGRNDCLLPSEDYIDGTSPVNFGFRTTIERSPTMGGLFSSLVHSGQSSEGVAVPRISTQLNKLSRQFPTDVSSSGVRLHRLLSKSSDGLSDLPYCEPVSVSSSRHGQVLPFTNWKPVTCSSPQYPVSTNDTESKIVPSVRCELVGEMLNTDCCLMLSHDQSNDVQLLILDCRPFVSYNSNHVRGALNVSCSDCITRKRLLTGRASLGDLVSGTEDAKERYRRAISIAQSAVGAVQVVVYDDDTEDFESLPAGHSLRLVVSCLRKADIDVYFMFGGLKAFHKEFSYLCSRPGSPISRPLHRSPSTPAAESCKIDNAKISQILAFLFIGNEHDAADRTLLKQHGIDHVLNVTSHVPLYFESDGVTYRRYPAADNGTENLRQYFDDAIQFIDGVRERQGRVMVHCQAGVSRSSTIAIAYIMARSSLSMLDTFRFVKSRRSIVAPNFNFLGQLLDFEGARNQGVVPPRPDLDVTGLISFEYITAPSTPTPSFGVTNGNQFDNAIDGVFDD